MIEVRGDTVLLATNRHVAVPRLSEIPARLLPKGSKPSSSKPSSAAVRGRSKSKPFPPRHRRRYHPTI